MMSDRLTVILPPVLSAEERIEKALNYSSLTEGDGSGSGWDDGWDDGWVIGAADGEGWGDGCGYGSSDGDGGSSDDV